VTTEHAAAENRDCQKFPSATILSCAFGQLRLIDTSPLQWIYSQFADLWDDIIGPEVGRPDLYPFRNRKDKL
jgi:hypothetical protein